MMAKKLKNPIVMASKKCKGKRGKKWNLCRKKFFKKR